MKMSKYIIKRFLYSILVLLGLSIIIFVISRIVPGDPARMALGPRAPEYAVDNLRAEMHLDEPLYMQYVLWLGDALKGDFGQSLITRRAVAEDIVEFLPATMEIVIISALIVIFVGINLGILSARYSNRWFDGVIRVFSYLGIVTPAFVWAIIFILIFGYTLPIFPTIGRLSSEVVAPQTITGMYMIDGLITGNFAAVGDSFMHIFLPALALSMGPAAQAARITRSSMTENEKKDYIVSARAFGIPQKFIMKHQLLKPSLIPTVSVMALDIASLIGNAFLVELLFNFPGLSRYGVTAMLNKDLPAISAVVLVLGIFYILANIVIDIIVSFLDPRIRSLGGAQNA